MRCFLISCHHITCCGIAAVEPPENICTARLWGFAPCWVFRKRQPPVASLEKQPYHFYTPTGLPPARVGKHKNLDEITTTLPLHFCLPQYLSPYICAGINIHRLFALYLLTHTTCLFFGNACNASTLEFVGFSRLHDRIHICCHAC